MKPKSAKSVALPAFDHKSHTRVKKPIIRRDENTTMTISLSKELKLALRIRAYEADREISPMIVAGFEYLQATGWKGVPQAAKIRDWQGEE